MFSIITFSRGCALLLLLEFRPEIELKKKVLEHVGFLKIE